MDNMKLAKVGLCIAMVSNALGATLLDVGKVGVLVAMAAVGMCGWALGLLMERYPPTPEDVP